MDLRMKAIRAGFVARQRGNSVACSFIPPLDVSEFSAPLRRIYLPDLLVFHAIQT